MVSGSGKPLRQFIYSQDFGRLIMWVLEKYQKKDSIIISVGEKEEVSIFSKKEAFYTPLFQKCRPKMGGVFILK